MSVFRAHSLRSAVSLKTSDKGFLVSASILWNSGDTPLSLYVLLLILSGIYKKKNSGILMVVSLYVLNLQIRQWHQVIARLVLNIINVSVFSAHSTRSAVSLKASDKGLNLTEISKTAGWSNAKTLAMFYKKTISENFGKTIPRA